MTEIPQWLVYVVGSFVSMTAFIGFWMALSSRITKAETEAQAALRNVEQASLKIEALTQDTADYRERVAKEYIHWTAMKDIKDTLTQAIDRLGDRLDRFLERTTEK